MKGGGRGAAARQDEGGELLERPFESIDQPLERLDIGFVDTHDAGLLPMPGVGRRQRGAEIKKRALDRPQRIFERRIQPGRSRRAEQRIQLVDVSESCNPWCVLGDPISAEKIGLALIASSRVDFHCAPSAARGQIGVDALREIIVSFEELRDRCPFRHPIRFDALGDEASKRDDDQSAAADEAQHRKDIGP